MLRLLMYIINLSPILNFSNDSHFGSFYGLSNLRVSIFAFHSGSFISYFLSFSISKEYAYHFKFDIVKVIKLEDMPQYRDGIEDEKLKNFKTELDDKSPEQLDIITDFLKEKTTAAREPLSVLNDKIIANLSILTASTAFVGFLFSESVKESMSKLHLAFLSLTILLLLQAFFVIFDGIKTRGTSKSTVSGIVQDSTKRAVAESLYYDLLHTLRTSNHLATNVLNARKFLMSLFLSMAILFVIISFGENVPRKMNSGKVGSGIYLKSNELDIDSIVLLTKEIKDYNKVLVLCRDGDVKCSSLGDYLTMIGKKVHLSKVEKDFMDENSVFISEVIQ